MDEGVYDLVGGTWKNVLQNFCPYLEGEVLVYERFLPITLLGSEIRVFLKKIANWMTFTLY